MAGVTEVLVEVDAPSVVVLVLVSVEPSVVAVSVWVAPVCASVVECVEVLVLPSVVAVSVWVSPSAWVSVATLVELPAAPASVFTATEESPASVDTVVEVAAKAEVPRDRASRAVNGVSFMVGLNARAVLPAQPMERLNPANYFKSTGKEFSATAKSASSQPLPSPPAPHFIPLARSVRAAKLPPMQADLERILFSSDQIAARIAALAVELRQVYQGQPLTVVPILHGGLFFTADLLRALALPLRLEGLTVASYHGGTSSSGQVSFLQEKLPQVAGREVLLVDDILDTGRTLSAVKQRLEAECAPRSVKTCVLLDKRDARVVPIQADFVGFPVGNEFVVGYGLDFDGHYRNLPEIGVLKAAQ